MPRTPGKTTKKSKATRKKKKTSANGKADAAITETKPTRRKASKRTQASSTTKASSSDRFIRIRGAREHNLKGIDLDIPRDNLVVITGLSGSGKSSLAFDTIFAEGQRKYMESLSAYARQFLDQLKKPDVEEIEGIPPTIAIEQRSAAHNPRSTVATTTEIYDYLRLLYARCATPYSWAPTKTKKDGTITERSGAPISATGATQIVDAVLKFPEGSRLMVLAPVIRGKKGFHKETLEDLRAKGWARARVNGEITDLREALKEGDENPLKLGRYHKHDIDAVIDRIVLKAEDRQRLAEAVEAALRLADGAVVVALNDPDDREKWTDHAYSEKFADPEHPEYALEEISPRLFSFNSPFGACPTCHGLGAVLEFDPRLIMPDPDRPLGKGGLAPFKMNTPGGMYFARRVRPYCRRAGIDLRTRMGDLDSETIDVLLYGDDDDDRWPGAIALCESWLEKTESSWAKDHLYSFQSESECPTCFGDRLRIEALHVQLESSHAAETDRAFSESVIGRPKRSGKQINDGTVLNIAELSRLNINDAIAFIENLKLTQEQTKIAEPILREVGNRLRFLTSVGLEYLSLDRRTATLSGGEAQRIRLATQVGSGLVGACYVLDEPTIGLHPRDNARLIRTLRHLADIGNTVLVVEHDEEMIRAADHVLDIGPGPGVHGGTVVAQGTIDEICSIPASLTGDYLANRMSVETPKQRRMVSAKKAITIKGARANNLKSIDATFPLKGLLCVTGVSGSGKSTLVNDILLEATKQKLLGGRHTPGAHDRVNGLHLIDRVIEVDQSPIGRTPRSNPATYTGIFDDIRKLFAQTKEANIRGYQPGRFSFNVPPNRGGGRCEACDGQGVKKIEMHFLPDVYVECEVCRGARYNRETLQVTYRGKSIADVLRMTVEDACEFFENHPKIHRFTTCLRDVGLGYITLGQPSTQLSGGEAQRVKLATELGKGGGTKNNPTGETNCLYILDEPTTGLHFEDVRKLIDVMHRLVDAGNTCVVIEHNLDVIKNADWILDLGPEGGDKGGTIVAEGPPESVASSNASHTGSFLKELVG